MILSYLKKLPQKVQKFGFTLGQDKYHDQVDQEDMMVILRYAKFN